MLGHVSRFVKLNKNFFVALGCLVALALVSALVVWVVLLYQGVSVPKEDRIPEVTPQTLVPTELSLTLSTFGPWQSPRVSIDGAFVSDPRALIIMQEDGGVRVSAFSLYFPNKSWREFKPLEISSLTVAGSTVFLQTNKQRHFIISTVRPFILEQTPTMIYLVTLDRKIWAVNLEEGLALRYSLTN